MNKEPEIRIELEPSNYAKTRQKLLNFQYIPTLKEAKRLLGKLAGFIYAECDVGLRHFVYEFCNSPPYGDMWVSPSGLLREECILRAPPTKRHMKDFNHEGAITMGWLIERNLLRYFDIELQSILDAQKELLMSANEKSIENQIKDAIQREKDACFIESEQLVLSFDKKLQQEFKDITKKIHKQNEGDTLNKDENEKRKWEAKIKVAVEETTKNITTQFLLELSRQEEEIALQFKGEFMKQETQRQFEINKEEAKFKKILENVKHQLECKNIANMMYIMCMERHKCIEERETLEKYYKDELLQLSKTMYKDKEIIELLQNSICQELQELKIRETCILEILKQYKEFIGIALKGAPIHAKFLLSIEKLLLFELTETLAKLKPCKNTEGEMTDTEESILTIEDSKEEKEVLESKKEKGFVLEKKMYVRQIFRKFQDLLAKTMGEPGDELWGEDAQLYIKALRESVPNIKLTDSKLLQLSNTLFPDKSEKIAPHRNSFVQFKLSQDSAPYNGLVKVEQIDEPPFTRKFKRRKSPLKYRTPIGDILSRIDYSQLGKQETSPSLLSTKNSLEIMQKAYPRKSNSQHSLKGDGKETLVRVAQEQEVQDGQSKKSSDINLPMKKNSVNINGILSLDTKDSLILRQSSMIRSTNKSFTCSPKDSIEVKNDSAISAVLRKQSSKLLETRDSVAYLKESKLALLTSGLCNICHQTDSPSQVHDKDYCCKRCAKNKSFELVNGQLIKRELLEQDERPKQVKLTHVDIIEGEQKPKANVVICSDDISRPRELSNTYRPSKTSKEKKSKSKADQCQQLFSSFARVEGDATTNEHLQNNNEFTKDRVRSFIKLMDAHPNLIKLFTSCQQ